MEIKRLFLQEATFGDHLLAHEKRYGTYASTLMLLLEGGVELSQGTLARVLAACWARRDHELSSILLAHESVGVAEVVKALQLLDAGRQARALERRIGKLTEGSCGTPIKPRRLAALRSKLHDLRKESGPGSLSGALCRHVRRWVQGIPPAKLEFYAMTFPLAPFRTLSDLVHLSKNDFQLPWFLDVVFGGSAPAGSMLADCLSAKREDLVGLLSRYQVPYSFLRLRFLPLSPKERLLVASYESIDTLLWYYEELTTPDVDNLIERRLRAGEVPTFGYGKLMERLMLLRDRKSVLAKQLLPLCDARLLQMRLPLDPPVVVLGDASSSMQVAIRVSTIIGSLLSAISKAELRFFHSQLLLPPVQPRNVDDVLKVATEIKANGSTAPAAALYPSLEKRKEVRWFVLVTDEEENTKYKNKLFREMLQEYLRECAPARVAFVSFIGQAQKGQMVSDLRSHGIPCLQFRLDKARPDLTKLDALLGLLAAEAESFEARAQAKAEERARRMVGEAT